MHRHALSSLEARARSRRRTGCGSTTSAMARGELEILILPGITSPAITWEFVAEELARDYRVLTMDLRGRGLSDRGASGTYRETDYALDVAEFMDAVGLVRPVVLSHSMGARIATAFGALYPDKHGPVADGRSTAVRSRTRPIPHADRAVRSADSPSQRRGHGRRHPPVLSNVDRRAARDPRRLACDMRRDRGCRELSQLPCRGLLRALARMPRAGRAPLGRRRAGDHAELGSRGGARQPRGNGNPGPERGPHDPLGQPARLPNRDTRVPRRRSRRLAVEPGRVVPSLCRWPLQRQQLAVGGRTAPPTGAGKAGPPPSQERVGRMAPRAGAGPRASTASTIPTCLWLRAAGTGPS